MANSFLYDNKFISNGVTFSCTDENPLYPLANLIDYNAAKSFRTNLQGAPDHVVADFGGAVSINTVCLANCNLSSAGSLKIQASTTSNFAALTVDETIDNSLLQPGGNTKNIYHKLASSFSYQYWRLRIDDSFSTDGIYEIGEWALGTRASLGSTQAFEMPWTRSFPDPNVLHQTEWFQDYVYGRDLQDIQNFQVEYRGVTSGTVSQLRSLKKFVKNSLIPFFFCPNDTDPGECFYVRMISDFEVIQETGTAYSVRFSLRELARGLALPSAD